VADLDSNAPDQSIADAIDGTAIIWGWERICGGIPAASDPVGLYERSSTGARVG